MINPVQWESLSTLPTAASSFSEHDGRIWAANGNLYYSDDDGITWTQHPDFLFEDITQVVAGEFGVIATRRRFYNDSPPYANSRWMNFFRSDASGENFEQIDYSANLSKHHYGNHYTPGVFKKSDTEVVVPTARVDGLNRTSGIGFSSDGIDSWDGGESWTSKRFDNSDCLCTYYGDTLQFALSAGIEHDSLQFLTYAAGETNGTEVFIEKPEGFFASTGHMRNGRTFMYNGNDSLAYSDDLGANWNIINYDLPGDVSKIKFVERSIIISAEKAVFEVEYDNLAVANLIFETNLTPPNKFYLGMYSSSNYFDIYDSYIYFEGANADFISDLGGVYRRAIGSETFELVHQGLEKGARNMQLIEDRLWAEQGSYRNRVWHSSDDGGLTWQVQQDSFLYNEEFDKVFLLGGYGGHTFVLNDEAVYGLENSTGIWTALPQISADSKSLNIEGGFLLYSNNTIFFTTDGISFTEIAHPAPGTTLVYFDEKVSCLKDGIRYSSSDFGNSWTEEETGLSTTMLGDITVLENNFLRLPSSIGSTPAFPSRSPNKGLTWFGMQNMYSNGSYGNLSNGATYLGTGGNMIFYNSGGHMVVSGDEGTTWYIVPVPFSHYHAYVYAGIGYLDLEAEGPVGIVFCEDHILAYTSDQGLFKVPYTAIKDQINTDVQLHNIMKGRLYKDFNDNCEYDAGDLPIAGKVISFNNESVMTSSTGEYSFTFDLLYPVDIFDYETSPILHQEIHCEEDVTGSVYVQYLVNDSLDIAFYPTPGLTDVKVEMWTTSIVRPGKEIMIKAKVTNAGNISVSDLDLNVNFDESVQTFLSGMDGGEYLGAGLINFPVDLEIDEAKIFSFSLMNSESLVINDILSHTGTIENTGDAVPGNNTFIFDATVISSFDPNDKAAYSNQEILPLNDNELTYRIRFQNTGNDTAFTVVVVDTLPEQLDLLSLEMIDASHDYELKINNPKILEWTFDNILLPDSTTNEALSHGYILFKIKTLEDVVDGDMLPNDAAIYFDFNEPVITNEVVTLIEKGQIDMQAAAAVCLGEEWNGMIINEDITHLDTLIGEVYDTVLTTFITALPTYDDELFVTGGTGAQVLDYTLTADSVIMESQQSISGCDSLTTYHFSLLQTEVFLEDAVCYGDEWNGTVITENTLFRDTIYNPESDTIFITNVSPLMIFDEEVLVTGGAGTIIAGVAVYADTSFVETYASVDGCDSLVTYNFTINEVEVNTEIGVCQGDEWNGMVINEDMTHVDTIFGPEVDSIFVTEISALPVYQNEIGFGAASGTIVNGVTVYSDTTFTLEFATIDGCDSLITYTIDVLSSIESADNEMFNAVLYPNPTANKTRVTIYGKSEAILSADVLSLKGDLLFHALVERKIVNEEFSFEVKSQNLPAGVYYLRIQSQSGETQYLKFIKI